MKRIDKKKVEKFDETFKRLKEARKVLEAKLDEEIAPLVENYNAIVEEVNAATSEVSSSIEDFINDKSERWLESDKGVAFGEWKDEWDGIQIESLDPLTVTFPDINALEEELRFDAPD